MRLRDAGLVVLVSCASGWSAGSAGATPDQDAPPSPEIGVSRQSVAGAEIVEIVLPGRSIGAPVPAVGGDHDFLFLVAPEDAPKGPRSLYGAQGTESLEELATDLPPEIDAIGAFDFDGDGRLELVLGEPGTLYSIDLADGGRPRAILEAPGLDLAMLSRRGLIQAKRALILQPRVGRLETFRLAANGAIAEGGVDLPMRARRVPGGLRLSTPTVRFLKGADGASPILAVGPESRGTRRLVTTLIDLEADVDAEPLEAWCQLSGNEKITQSWLLTIDGKPMLAVAALNADKIGIFEKKKLRVFPLRTDRTRAGSRPSLEIQTATRNWYQLGVHVTDLDLDGRQDLVVVQPDGLGAKKLVIEAFRGLGNGGFFQTARRSVVVAPEARWDFGQDFDGDGVGDLVVVDDSARLLVHRGLATGKKLAVEKKPRWNLDVRRLAETPDTEVVIEIGVSSDGTEVNVDQHAHRLQIDDFDGDGHREILLRSEIAGRSVLRFVELH